MGTKIKRIFTLILLMAFCLPEERALLDSHIPEPYPLPSLTGNYREDFLAIAHSQLGYSEAPDGSNYFAYWYDPSNPTANWCTEFSIWCADQANIPVTIIPKASGVHSLRGFYMTQGRFYHLSEGITASLAGFSGIETISIADAQPGDILLQESHNNIYDGPDHITIFLSYSDGKIKTISGNTNNTVAINYISPSAIHGICKPAFDGSSAIKRSYTCNLPDTVTRIYDLSYYDIENLTDFYMGNQVTAIGRSAFRGCKNMTMHCDYLKLNELGKNGFLQCQCAKNC